jgi:hypothetical protein
MSKYFTDFTEIGSDNNRMKSNDYVIGYRSEGAPEEVRISASNLINNMSRLLSPGSIDAGKMSYSPVGVNVQNIVQRNVDIKLSEFFSVDDFSILTSAGIAGAGKRLFVSKTTVPLTLTIHPTIGDFLTIQDALNAVAKWHIEKGAVVVLKLLAGTHTVFSNLDLNHPFGSRIQLVGDSTASADQVVIQLDNTISFASLNFDLFTCSYGNSWGLIDNLTITGKGLGTGIWSSNNYAAIKATYGATINLGTNVKIDNWYYGLYADYGAVINGPGVTADECGVAVYANNGSHITATGATLTNNRVTDGDSGYGVLAESGSQINCSGSTATNNYKAGFAAFSNSQLRALGCKGNSNDGSGFFAKEHGEIAAYDYENSSGTTVTTQAKNNGVYGFEAISGGGIYYGDLSDPTATVNNTKVNSYVSTTTNGTSALVSSSQGKLMVATPDTNSIILSTQLYNQHLEITDIGASTTSRLKVAGGNNTKTPILSAEGSSSNINFDIKAKGTGHLTLDKILSPVNIKGVYSSGATATISNVNAYSADTETVHIFLNPQNEAGGGYVRVGKNVRMGENTALNTPVVLSGLTINSYVTIKDINGNEVKLLCGSPT